MSGTHVLALPSPLANIHQYRSAVERFPRLEAEEERALAERFHAENDLEAAWQLVTSHLRYVVYIARSYSGYTLPQEDLIQEGNVGLMQAVRRFDPHRGVRLITYAAYWIRAQILDYILRNWRIVKVATTKARRKLFYKLRNAKQHLEWLNRAEADEIAEALKVRVDDVIDMESKLYLSDESFEQPFGTDDETWAPATFISDDSYEPATICAENEFASMAKKELAAALLMLDGRSRDILESRWLAEREGKKTLQELGERYGISAERVRQLEVAAIDRLRETIMPRLGLDCAEDAA
jgi:RNA polymerase sigma-32 factor